MTRLLLLLLCSIPMFAQETVFRGTPTLRVLSTTDGEQRDKLDAAQAQKYDCVIVKKGKKYLWASRNDAPLTRVDAKEFTYFIHPGGAGYVKVFTGDRSQVKLGADYIENINQNGFEVVTYWGTTNSAVADGEK
jgi:hypothetical protein